MAVNFSTLTNQSTVSAGDQLLIRLNNSLSGADGFGRTTLTNFNNSLNVTTVVRSTSGNWNNSFTTTQSNSAKWSSVYTTTASNSAAWNSTSTTVRSNSASWTGANTPKIAYVDASIGSNTTGQIGYPSLPFQTLAAALEAGTNTGLAYMVKLGAGTYSYTFSEYEATFHTLCKRIDGIDKTLTALNIFRTGTLRYNQDGAAGPIINTELNDMSVYVNIRGEDIDVSDGNTYTAGTGGQLTVVGNVAFIHIDCRGGDGTSSAGTAVGGSTGVINIRGAYLTPSMLISAANGSGTGGLPTGTAYIYLDNCYLRDVTPYADSIIVGRSSYTATFFTPSTDLGGNAVY